MAEVVENFYGVYLLFSKNPKFTGRTYIGFTVNPNRRIQQHNKGVKSGGARRTSSKGPWIMVLVIHGFPNEISALRFEWAWQHPDKSRRLNHISKKKSREKKYDFCLRVLAEMLRVGPWNRLPLTIRWLSTEHMKDFLPTCPPPPHMPVVFGHVLSKKVSKQIDESEEREQFDDLHTCTICHELVLPDDQLTCLDMLCPLVAHVICLAKKFLNNEESGNGASVIPIDGTCPLCGENMLWGDLVRKKNGCYADLVPADNSDVGKESESD